MWLLYLPLVIPALAGAAARPLAARLEPRHATWLLTTAAVALAACSLAALALLAAFAAARAPLLAAVGDYSPEVMRRGDPISAAAGVAAALALTGAAVAVMVMFGNRARALAESYRRAAGLHAEDGIVVVPGPAIEAYALPGWPGRIVVSGRLLDCLDERRRTALDRARAGAPGQPSSSLRDRGPARRRGQPAPDPGGPGRGLHRGAVGG